MSQPHQLQPLALLLLLLTAAAIWRPGSCLVSIYKGGEANPIYRFLSDHAFFIRRNRTVPPVFLQFPETATSSQFRSGALTVRAVLLPENETLLARFAEAVNIGDKESRRRLFLGVVVPHSTKRFTGKRFLRILELLRTNYLDLLLVAGRPCGHSQRDRLACGENRLTPAFLHNWRNLAQLARKRRVLNLGLRNYPLAAVRTVHQLSTPECLDFPNRSACAVWLPGNESGVGDAGKKSAEKAASGDGDKDLKKDKKKVKKTKNVKKKHKKSSSRNSKVDINNAYSMRRAARNVNYLTVVQAAFNPHHRHRVLRHWCHRHSVVLLADEALGGPHADEILADPRLTSAASAVRLPVRTAVLHWALKKRVAIAVNPEEAAELGDYLGILAVKSQHLARIDSTVESDRETQFFLVPNGHDSTASWMLHNEL